jgi:O-antigen ligase
LALQSAIAIVQVKKPGLVNLSALGAEEQSEETVVAGSVALPNVDKGTTTIAGEIEHRPSGLLIHPNVLAAYLVLSIPLAIAGWVIASSLWMQSLCLLSAGAGLTALYFSLSRSGWAGLGLALLLISCLWWKLPLQKATAAKKLIIAVAVVGALVGIAAQSEKIYLRLTESASEAVKFRRELAGTAWNMTKAHPFFGVGYNSFTENMDEYDEGGMSRIKKFPAHNVYLLELGEGGIITGLAFVVLVGAMLVRLFKAGNGARDPVLRTIAIFTACGVCGFWLTQISDYVYRIPILTTLVWFHAGLVFAAANLRESLSA